MSIIFFCVHIHLSQTSFAYILVNSAIPETMVPVPTVLPENHRWQHSKADPLLYQRRGNGAETIVGLEGPNSEGQYDLYYRVNMHLSQNSSSTKISLCSLKDSFKLALLDVRLQHPEIACTVAWDTAVGIEPIIQYKSPVNDTDAVEWAEERIQVLTTPQTALDLRTVLVKQRELIKPGPSAPVKVYILADVANQTVQLAPNSRVDILIHLNHLFWDGIGVRMFVGDLLKRIGEFLDTDNIASRKPQLWGQEKANLPQPILDIEKISTKSLGPKFEPWWNEYIENMFKSTVSSIWKHLCFLLLFAILNLTSLASTIRMHTDSNLQPTQALQEPYSTPSLLRKVQRWSIRSKLVWGPDLHCHI